MAVAAYRDSQHGTIRIPLRKFIAQNEDFLNFNIFNAFHRYCLGVEYENNICEGPGLINYTRGAAYGGLLFSKKMIDRIGYPDERLVLYWDDVEYILRILNTEGVIWVNKNVIVDDVVENYSANIFKVPIYGFVLADSDVKVYYIIRNRAYIDKYIEKKRSAYYFINRYAFLFLAALGCLTVFRFKRLVTILSAYRDGRNASLGMKEQYKLQ